MKTKKMKIEIKYGHTQSVIFSHEFDNNSIKITLEAAIKAGADLGDCGKLTGDRPYFEIGPIGSRSDKICSFLTDKGIFIQAGCFFGSIEEFEQKVIKTHGDNIHAKEYFSAIALIQFHFNWWNNKE